MRRAHSVGIMGVGWVGRAMQKQFPSSAPFDPAIKEYSDGLADVRKCSTVFVCVPTPCKNGGRLDTSEVFRAVKMCGTDALFVLRSTLNPGDSDEIAQATGARIVVQPEYLGETANHPMSDLTHRQWMIIGGHPNDRRELIDLYTTVCNANVRIRQVSRLEAEVVKLSENRAIAFKLAQCQELYDVCEQAGIDYYTIRDAVYGDDPRFNLWWTFVSKNKRGFDSKCIPKDVFAWLAWAESFGGGLGSITKSILTRNQAWTSK